MSLSLVVRFRDDSTVNLPSGEALWDGLEVLDALADSGEVQGLSDFADSREIPEDFAGDLDELRELLGESSDWFDTEVAAEALDRLAEVVGSGEVAHLATAVRETADVLRSHPGEFQFDVV